MNHYGVEEKLTLMDMTIRQSWRRDCREREDNEQSEGELEDMDKPS